MSRYVNPFTDFGFKKLFGEEANKDLLKDFLNSFLPQKHQIKDLRFKKNERLGATGLDRKAIFDIFCESLDGEQFIVELQKAKQNYFIDRTVYYASFPIQQQAPRGDWDFHLKAVYCVGILDFIFDETPKNQDKCMHSVMLVETETQDIFYDKLKFIYFEMPKFRKDLTQLQDRKDKWLYFIRNLDNLQNIPQLFMQDPSFEKAFDEAEIAKFDRRKQGAYEKSLKYYRDLKNVTDTAFDEGKIEGIEEGIEIGKEEERKKFEEERKKLKEKLEEERKKAEEERKKAEEDKKNIARNLKNIGLDYKKIAETTGISVDEIEEL